MKIIHGKYKFTWNPRNVVLAGNEGATLSS